MFFFEVNNVGKTLNSYDFTTSRQVTPDNLRSFQSLLKNANWEQVFKAIDVDTKFNSFLETFSSCLSTSCPLRTKRIPKQRKLEWLTPGIRISGESLKNLQSLSKTIDCAILKLKLKKYSTIYQKVIQESKRMSIESKLRDAKFQPDILWKTIKGEYEATGKNSDIPFVYNNGIAINDLLEIAQDLNSYFINVKTKLSQLNWTNRLNPATNSFFLFEPSAIEVLDAINSLKNKNTLDIYGISSKLVKSVATEILKPFTDIMQAIFEQSIFPERAKYARVTPLLKKRNSYEISNLRPISCLPIFSKIIEKIVTGRMNQFLTKYNIVYEHQYGYCLNKGTEDALFRVTDLVQHHLNNGRTVGIIFLDLTKAFDRVDHDLLLRKLHSYGFRGTVNDLLESYLSNRKQKVVLKQNGKIYESKFRKLVQGVPQGSILGPVLFKIFINDLPLSLDQSVCETIIFADDTTIVLNAPNLTTLNKLFEDVLLKVQAWCEESGLILNETKTHFMKINDTRMGINHTKYLGILLDNKMNFKPHIDDLCSKLNKACYQLRQLRKKVDLKTLLLIYHANFFSIMRYGIIVWGASSFSNKAFLVQKRAIRVIFGLKRTDSCVPYFKKYKLLTLPAVYILELMKFFDKRRSHFEVNKNRRVIYSIRERKEHYQPTLNRYKMCELGVRNMAIRFFNIFCKNPKIESHMKNCNSSFVKAVQRLLEESCYYRIDDILLPEIAQP